MPKMQHVDKKLFKKIILRLVTACFLYTYIFFFLDLSQYRPVYAPKDFLEVLLCIYSPNYRSME
jgi:hypothetical protein